MPRRDKTPKAKKQPAASKQPRTSDIDPSRHERETLVWSFGILDQEGIWGWRTAAASVWWTEILPKLQSFESMTWDEIAKASGGRIQGNNHHFVRVEKLTKQAKDRLVELKQEDVSELFSLRLTGQKRIYGVRDRRALKLLWYDKYHGTNAHAVYPVQGGS